MDCLCRGRCALERCENFVRAPAYAAVKVGTAKNTGYLLRHVDRLHQAAALDVQASAPAISVNG